jgi:hypothetical protein
VEIASVAGPLITALATIVVTVIGLMATGRARKAERSANENKEEADRLRRENEAMDARTHHLIDQLQEDNDRLRAALRARETRARKTILPPPGGDT